MNTWKKLLALALCLSMIALVGCQSLAETTPAEAAPAETTAVVNPELTPDSVLATVNGVDVTWKDAEFWFMQVQAQYSSNYDFTLPENVRLGRAVAQDKAVEDTLLLQKAAALGLDQLTDEERADLDAQAETDWQTALDSYVAQYGALTDESTDADKAAATQAAVEYFTNLGYSLDILKKLYANDTIMIRVQNELLKDVTVTDEEVEAQYQALLAADQEAYGEDVSAYEQYNSYANMMAYYGAGTMRKALYRPAGYRSMQHLYIKVDDALLSAYTDLRARLEEQMDSEASEAQSGEAAESTTSATADPNVTTDPSVTAEPTAEPVTQAQVDQALADILASVQPKLDEINQHLADGKPFEEIIKLYDSDNSEDQIYEVCVASTGYVPEFVTAAFSVDAIGDVSAPVVSELGVHILKYLADVPAGPVEFTDDERAALKAEMLTARQSEAYAAAIDAEIAAATITYTGLIPSMDEINAEMAAASDGSEPVQP